MLRSLVLAIALFPSVSGSLPAADWTRYVNPRFGAAVDVPADFTADGPAQVAGEGKRFRASNGRAVITIWGGPSQGADFLDEMRRRIGAQVDEGWAITYRSETPDWAAWGGTRGGHVFYAKTILVCNGQQTANVRLDYPAMDVPGFDAVVNRLGQSLGQDGACF